MSKRELVFCFFGVFIGAAIVTITASREIQPDEVKVVSETSPALQRLQSNLLAKENEIEELREQVAALSNPTVHPKPTEPSLNKGQSADRMEGDDNEPAASDSGATSTKWKISAIEKFIPLTDQQRERLERSFSLPKGDPSTESLDQIIGAEQATYYREQVKGAFKRMEEQQLDREVVWLSRQLKLTEQQEQQIRTLFAQVESEIKDNQRKEVPSSPTEKVKAMIEENKRRESARAAKAKDILTPDQYEAYLRERAESPEADVEVFHGEG